MIVKRFQNHVAESRIALPFIGVYAFLICAAGGLFADKLWIQFGLLALSSFLIMVLNNTNALIRIYSRMVSCSFLALAVMSHFLFIDIRCGIVQSCFIAFYLFLFSSYQDNRAIGRIFYAFMMLGIASVFFVQILYLLPIIWILVATNVMIRSFRAYFASLLGLILRYLFIATYYLYYGKFDYIPNHFLPLYDNSNIIEWNEIPLTHIVTASYVALLSIIGMIHFRLNNYKDKIRTRMLFEIFSVMSLSIILFIGLQPQHLDILLALLIVNTSPMIGHYIALTYTRITNISFYIILILTVLLTFINIWIPF